VAGGTTSIMSGLLRERPPVVCLWGGHRPAPDLDTRTTPSNADKGARELKGRGYDVRSVSPWTRGKAPSGIARKLQYVTSVADVLKASRPADAVLYTADLPWIRVLAAMKQAGLLRRRLVVHWGGIDFDPQSLSNSTYLRKYDKLFAAIDAIWLASENERQIWSEALPHHADRMAFHPMFVDIEYYRKIMPATLSHDVVAIGSDSRRDWEIPIGLAATGLRVAIVTEDHEVRRRINALPPAVQSNVTLAFRSGFQQSARIAAAGKCLLVATTPNFRFSGSTTLAVAIALGRPLVIDDPFDLPAYGVQPGVHCESFIRGDLASAQAAVRRIVSSPDHARALANALADRRDRVDIEAYVDRLEASFRPGWSASHTSRPAAGMIADSPGAAPAWP
jgi:hypothetical protein